MEKQYLLNNKERILNFSRELWLKWELTKEQLNEVYFYNFVKNV